MTTNEQHRLIGPMHHHTSIEAVEAVQLVEKEMKPYEEFLIKFKEDWCHHLAQALAFSLLTAVVPIAVLLLTIFGLFLGNFDPQIQNMLNFRPETILPQPLAAPVTQLLGSVSDRFLHTSGIVVFSSIVFALVFGSRLFTLMEVCFDVIYDLPPRPFVRKNLVATGMLFLFTALTPIIILASTAPAFVLSLFHASPLSTLQNGTPPDDLFVRLASIASSVIFSLFLFEAIYVIVPYRHLSFRTLGLHIRTSWRGTLVATVAMQLSLLLFPLYVSNFLSSYVGQVGFALLLLAFFYLIAFVLLLGAEVNAFFAEGIRVPQSDLITQASLRTYRQ